MTVPTAQVKYLEPGEIVIQTLFDTQKSSTAKWFFRDQPMKLGDLNHSIRSVVTQLLNRRTGVSKICVRENSLRIKHDKDNPQNQILLQVEHAFNEADILLL